VNQLRRATSVAVNTPKPVAQKVVPMMVNVELAENSFLLPSAESEIILVLRSNIVVTYKTNPEAETGQTMDKQMFQSAIQEISRRDIDVPDIPTERRSMQSLPAPVSNSREKMSVLLKLQDCELFMIKFVDFFREESSLSSKRELILPFTTELKVEQHALKRIKETDLDDFDEITVNKVALTIGNQIEIKYTVLDIELLLGIVNYQLLLMNKGGAAAKAPETADSHEESQVIAQGPTLSYTYVAFKIEEFKMTLINDNSNIFAPVLIFKLKRFSIYADLEHLIKVSLGFGFEGYYFNSEIFHWEPFLEPTSLVLEYQTKVVEGGILGKMITLSNSGNDDKFNFNFSIAFLTKIKFLLDTWEAMKIKNDEEAERVKNVKLETYLKSIQADTIREALRSGAAKEGAHTSYISPIRITNTTGYPIMVKYYKKIIDIRQGNPVLKSMDEKFVELDAGESKPFSTDESMEDYQDVTDKLQVNLSYKFISIQIRHPEFTINKIDNVNVIINHSKKINLKGKEKNLSDYKIIYSSRTHRDIKEILISSPMMFVNTLGERMKIVIKHPFGNRSFDVDPGQKVYIPFDLVAYLFDIYVGQKKMVFKGKFESFYLKQTGHFLILTSEDKSTNIVLKVYQEVKFRYMAKLVAIPAISFRNNLPLPISLTLANHTNATKKIDLEKEGQIQLSDYDIGTCLKMSVSVPGFKSSDLLTLIEMDKQRGEYKFSYPKSIRLVDIQGRDTYINLVRIRDGYSHFFYSIFCNVVMVNETPFPVICHSSEKFKMQKSQVGGQTNLENVAKFDDKIALLGGTKTFVNMSLGEDPRFQSTQYSNTISTQGITSGVFQVPIKSKQGGAGDMVLELGYTMRLFYLSKNDVTASKVILLTPKTILYNNSNSEIKITSEDLNATELLPEQKLPLFIFKKNQKNQKLISFSVVHKGEVFSTFVPLDLNKVGTAIFLMANETKSAFRVFKVEITLQADYIFVTFADRTGHRDFSLVNNTEFDVRFEQVDQKGRFDFFVKSGESAEFGLVDPYGVKAVDIQAVSRESRETVAVFGVKLHKLTKELHQFKSPQRFNLFSNLELKDDTRQLTIKNAPLEEVLEEEKRKKTKKEAPAIRTIMGQTKSDFTNIDIRIKEFGLSIIAKYQSQTVELFYAYLSELRLVAILAEEKKEIQFVVKYLNIDSNYSNNCKYPVLLTVSRSKDSLDEKEKEANFFNFHVIMNNSSNESLMNIDVFEFEILPLTFTAEFSLINVVLAFKKQIDKIFASKVSSDYLQKYFRNPAADLTQSAIGYQESLEWQTVQFTTSNRWIYCGEFKMSLIKILMTFNMSSYATSEVKDGAENSNVDLLIETFGVTFLNIDESPLSFSGLKLESVFESVDAFTNIILNHLKDQKNMNIAKLVGSLDIIGNPVSLFSNLSSGVVEFFEKPVSGFVKGPVEGFYGIADGSTSLIKNTAAGTFNTISKITSSLASGLTALSMDKEYLNKRNINRSKKPQNAIDGVGKGVVSIGKGFLSGITGVVTQPIKEVKSSGATGIFLGMFKGVSGLITKPLGGIMDATSQTAEGIKKSVQSKDDRANELKIRVPRVFYSSLQYFKVYNRDDSETMKILKTLENNKFENDTFFDSIEVTVQENAQKHFIVLTNENFLILNAGKSQVVFRIEIRDISRMRYIDENNLNIDYYVSGEKRSLQLNNQRENIFKIINTINYCKYINHVDAV
jgi:vacuolar protein sorting-associated protein 13A/C